MRCFNGLRFRVLRCLEKRRCSGAMWRHLYSKVLGSWGFGAAGLANLNLVYPKAPSIEMKPLSTNFTFSTL